MTPARGRASGGRPGPWLSWVRSSGATFGKSLSDVRPMSKILVPFCPKTVQTMGLSENCPKVGYQN